MKQSFNKVKKVRYIGLIKGSGHTNQRGNGHRKSTVIVQAKINKDSLSSDLWQYLGARYKTRQEIANMKEDLLKAINKTYNTNFKNIIVE